MISKPEKVVLVQLIDDLDEGQARDLIGFLNKNTRFSFVIQGKKHLPHSLQHEPSIKWTDI